MVPSIVKSAKTLLKIMENTIRASITIEQSLRLDYLLPIFASFAFERIVRLA